MKALTKPKQSKYSISDVIPIQPAFTGLTATSPHHRKPRRVREKKRGGSEEERGVCATKTHRTRGSRDDG